MSDRGWAIFAIPRRYVFRVAKPLSDAERESNLAKWQRLGRK